MQWCRAQKTTATQTIWRRRPDQQEKKKWHDELRWIGRAEKNTKNKYVDSRQPSTRVCTLHSLQLKRKKKSRRKISICSLWLRHHRRSSLDTIFRGVFEATPRPLRTLSQCELEFFMHQTAPRMAAAKNNFQKRRTSGWGDVGGRNLGKTTRTFCVSSRRKVCVTCQSHWSLVAAAWLMSSTE